MYGKKSRDQKTEHFTEGQQDVDYVLTTTEVTRMIKEAGMDLSQIEPEALDMPFGLSSGGSSDLWSNGWCDRGSSETSGTQQQDGRSAGHQLYGNPRD